jgi:hypothetical protein
VECEDDNVISTVLCAPETTLFNILTSRRIYSLYPTSFTQRMNFETYTFEPAPSQRDSFCPFRFGFTTYDHISSAYINYPCKEGCYASTRNIQKMEGISRFRWGGILGEYDRNKQHIEHSYIDPFEVLDIEWRIGSRCRNIKCKYYRHGFMS